MAAPNFSTAIPVSRRHCRASRPTHGRASVGAWLGIVLLLTACGSLPPNRPVRWVAPAVERHAQEWICRIAEDCRHIRLRLVDTDAVQATMLLGVELTLSRGLYVAVESEPELAFVIAHELAHQVLRHQVPRDLAKRLPIELDADRWAAQRLCELGIESTPGTRLLERMYDGEVALRDTYRTAGFTSDRARSELALHELATRMRADLGCAPPAGPPPARRSLVLLSDEAFDQLRAAALAGGTQPP